MTPEFKELELDSLFFSSRNARKDLGDLTGLTDSITDMGVLEPILVRRNGERYEVIAGSRRVKAAREAGHATIPARVLELTDVQAILTSLIENLQRQDMSVVERVEAYKELQGLEPAYCSPAALANAVGLTSQKIGQDLQAYEIAVALQPHGIRVESHFHRTSPERQDGLVLPEYHAVLLHQAITYLPGEDADTKLPGLARLIAPLSQSEAKELIEEVKAGRMPHSMLAGKEDEEDPTPPWHSAAGGRAPSSPSNAQAKRRHTGGVMTCCYCEQEVSLIHLTNGTHRVRGSSIHLPN